MKPILEMEHITKRFSKVTANEDISITLYPGEIISLLGENGAGKSTLMNILFGLIKPSSGTIRIDGREHHLQSPREGINAGLGMVHQHFMLIGNLSVTENIVLGQEPGRFGFFDYKKARQEVVELGNKFNLPIDPDTLVENLSVGLQQRVEILKALYRKARILILDEPTAVLTPGEVSDFFNVIKGLRDSGVSVIIITHKLEEVLSISSRVYILRRGKLVGERSTTGISKEELAQLMVGRDVVLQVQNRQTLSPGKAVLEIRDLRLNNSRGIEALKGLSLSVRPGEILGLAGVDGNGQQELAEAITGLRAPGVGSITFEGRDIRSLSIKERRESFLSYVPADRQKEGLVLPMSIEENILLGSYDPAFFRKGFILNPAALKDRSLELGRDYDIRYSRLKDPVSSLSGGNQQKVILARELAREPRFLLVCQPTRGLDVGAIEYIHKQILRIRDQGAAVLLISLELEEIFHLADRIVVIFEGKIAGEFNPRETEEAEVGRYMIGCGEAG